MAKQSERLRQRFLYACIAARVSASNPHAKTSVSLSIGRLVGQGMYGIALALTLLMRQTISILVAACVLRVVLHAPLSHVGTWLAAVLVVVPMDLRHRRWERSAEERRRRAHQQVIEVLGNRVTRAFEAAKQEGRELAMRVIPSASEKLQ